MTGVPGLGPLESAVMAVLWAEPDGLKTSQIIPRLDYPPVPRFTTVATVLDNLHAKGLVTRSMVRRQPTAPAWCYQAAMTRDEYLAGQVAALLACARDPVAVVAVALSARGRGCLD